MSSLPSASRRKFLAMAALAAIPAALVNQRALAADAELPHVSPDDPTAKALSYTADASKLDAKTSPTFKAGSACASCVLFQGKPGSAFGPCGVFPGKSVSAHGWCASYTKAG
jgi:hypothetical protein